MMGLVDPQTVPIEVVGSGDVYRIAAGTWHNLILKY
jgi:hypothetical protein